MFPNNILTFNSGWDENAKLLESYDDIRFIQKELKDKWLSILNEVAAPSEPASLMLSNPDGNIILIDQHV